MGYWQYLVWVGCVGGMGCAYEAHSGGSAASEDAFAMGDGGADPSSDVAALGDPAAGGEPGEAAGGGEPGESTEPVLGGGWHTDPAVLATLEAWRWRHATHADVASPDISRCEDRIRSIEVLVPSHEEFRRLCRRCDLTDPAPQCASMGRINACAGWGDSRDDDGVIGAPHALVVLDATRAADPVQRGRLIVHETVHHLGTCTQDGADAPHANDAWWCAGPDCVAGRGFAALDLL